MCTVSFVPLSNSDFILCSNRDESPSRKTLPPSKHEVNGVTALFPQDELAGGTWVGTSELGRVVCIMNGGFKPYDVHQQFARSRGLIVTEVLSAPSLDIYFKDLDLTGIAPFTLIVVLFQNKLALQEYIWDGAELHKKELPIETKIWSSRQLYSAEIAKLREHWFAQFLAQSQLDQSQLLSFHKEAGEGNPKTNLVMDRGFVKTTSISSFIKDNGQIRFRYEEIESGTVVNTAL
ncbi:MAG: NRDE family protein [Gilvibacter sp.]